MFAHQNARIIRVFAKFYPSARKVQVSELMEALEDSRRQEKRPLLARRAPCWVRFDKAAVLCNFRKWISRQALKTAGRMVCRCFTRDSGQKSSGYTSRPSALFCARISARRKRPWKIQPAFCAVFLAVVTGSEKLARTRASTPRPPPSRCF